MTNIFLYLHYLYILPDYRQDNARVKIKKTRKVTHKFSGKNNKEITIAVDRMVEFH